MFWLLYSILIRIILRYFFHQGRAPLFAFFVLSSILISPIILKAQIPEKATIESTRYSFDKETGLTTYFSPRVIFKNSEITANILKYDSVKKIFHLYGDIVYHAENVLITGEEFHYFSSSKQAIFNEASLFDNNSGIYATAKRIEKISEKTFILYESYLSKCHPSKPGWEVYVDRLEYNKDSFAYAFNNAIFLHSVPVFYQPFLLFPTKKGRSSGFLPPKYSFNGGYRADNVNNTQDLGNRVQVPYFWDINQENDLTITADLIEKRGLGVGFEYNYAFFVNQSGVLDYWFLDESRYNESQSSEQKRPTRYRFIQRHKQDLFWGGNFFFDYKETSDSFVDVEYFYTIPPVSGELLDHKRLNLGLAFPVGNGSINVFNEYAEEFVEQSVRNRTTNKGRFLNRLPQVTLTQVFSNLFNSNLSLDTNIEYTSFQRDVGWKGSRIIASAEASYLTNISFLNIVPSYTQLYYNYEVEYLPEKNEDIGDFNRSKEFEYGVGKKNLELNFELFKIFGAMNPNQSYKLSFIPKVIFTQIDDVDQRKALDLEPDDELQNNADDYDIGVIFDSRDRTPAQNIITLQWDSILFQKEKKGGRVQQIFEASLIQPYNLNRKNSSEQARTEFRGPVLAESQQETSPGNKAMPLRMIFNFQPKSFLKTQLFYRFDHETRKIIETRAGIQISTVDQSTLSLNYINNEKAYTEPDGIITQPESQRYNLTNIIRFDDSFQLLLAGTWDYQRNENIKADSDVNRLDQIMTKGITQLTYLHDCYSVRFRYEEEIREETTDSGNRQERLNRIFTVTFSIDGNDFDANTTDAVSQLAF